MFWMSVFCVFFLVILGSLVPMGFLILVICWGCALIPIVGRSPRGFFGLDFRGFPLFLCTLLWFYIGVIVGFFCANDSSVLTFFFFDE